MTNSEMKKLPQRHPTPTPNLLTWHLVDSLRKTNKTNKLPERCRNKVDFWERSWQRLAIYDSFPFRSGSRIFRRRGRQPFRRGTNIQICQIFPKNCMKLRKFWSVGGRPPPLDPPLVNCELGLSHGGCKKGASAEEEIKAPIVKDSSEFVHYFIFACF